MYKRDEQTGLLEKQCICQSAEIIQRIWQLFPDGKHLAVVNHESNSITTFAIDYEKKLLTMKGKPMKVEHQTALFLKMSGINEI